MIPLRGVPELEEGDDLAAELAVAIAAVGGLERGDVVVVAQKAVSKVEGRVVSRVSMREIASSARRWVL